MNCFTDVLERVDPNTGEHIKKAWSGWYDRSGRKIYEGDIVSLINEDGNEIQIICEFGMVKRQIYEHEVEISCFSFRMPDGRHCFPIVKNYIGKHDTELYKVIGHINN